MNIPETVRSVDKDAFPKDYKVVVADKDDLKGGDPSSTFFLGFRYPVS